MNNEFKRSEVFDIARSITNGMADYTYYLAVPLIREDGENLDYYVLRNIGDTVEIKYELVYHFNAEYIARKCCFTISRDAKTALIGFAAKKGVVCIDCESGQMLWNNTKIKKIDSIRFNNFDGEIIEVINKDLKFTYLDRTTGQVLDEERIKSIRQVLNKIRSSKNQKYLIACDTLSSRDFGNYTVYDAVTKSKTGSFIAQVGSMEVSFDITNDGRFAACSAYYKEGVSLIEVATGEVLWSQKGISYISALYFDKNDEKIIVQGRNRNVYVLNVQDGHIEEYITAEELFLNKYGEDIRLIDDNTALIGGKKITGPSFAYIQAFGTPNSVVLVPAGNEHGLQCYDCSGNLKWKTDVYIKRLVYREEDKTICGYYNVYNANKIVVLDAENGQVISQKDVNDLMCAFIDDGNTIVCNTGKMYSVSKTAIEEKEEVFEFII